MSRRVVFTSLVILVLMARTSFSAELVRGVRYKLSAGDLASGAAAVEDYKRAHGVDAEYLDAVGWLARGAEMLKRPDLADQYVAELRREITTESDETVIPLGAAIEVEARLLAARQGRGAAIRFLENELVGAKATSLQSRIRKNINLLSMEGHSAPPLDLTEFLGPRPQALAALEGKPVLLYFFAAGCGDCRGQSDSLNRLWRKYQDRGLQMIATTRLYGGAHDNKLPITPDEEKVDLLKTWKELYPEMQNVPVVVSTDSMVRYGVSATPTFALIDRHGIVRLYAPTRLSEDELSRRIDELLAER